MKVMLNKFGSELSKSFYRNSGKFPYSEIDIKVLLKMLNKFGSEFSKSLYRKF